MTTPYDQLKNKRLSVNKLVHTWIVSILSIQEQIMYVSIAWRVFFNYAMGWNSMPSREE